MSSIEKDIALMAALIRKSKKSPNIFSPRSSIGTSSDSSSSADSAPNSLPSNASSSSSNTKNSLGRGLSALLSDSPMKNYSYESLNTRVINLAISSCVPSKYQARMNFDEESLKELAESIKTKGVIQPIIVRALYDDAYNNEYDGEKSNIGKFEIIAGERRCRASKLAGFGTIPAIVMDFSDTEVMEVGLIENLQRKDLNAVEEALAYNTLYNELNYTHEEISAVIGKSRSYITNYLRILTLPEEVLNLIKKDLLSAGHAKMLVNVDDPIAVANQIINQQLSVKDTETLTKNVAKKKNIASIKTSPSDEELLQWCDNSLNTYKSLKIVLSQKNPQSGEIKIKYNNLNDLKEILNITNKK